MIKKCTALVLSVLTAFAMTVSCFAADVTEINWDDAATSSIVSQTETDEDAEIHKNKSKPYLALGADLSHDQLVKVLTLMGLAGQDLSGYDVIYVTNEMEHQYLDNYVSPSIIGKKALSSVLVKKAEKGHGVKVVTKNINYCTIEMYRNALLTAGVEDADIMVVGPTSISGTAALIGALKAYEDMSGEEVSDEELDTALNELVTTGEISDVLGDPEKVSDLIAFIKAQIVGKDLNTREEIKEAVEEAAKEYGTTLTGEEVDKIVELMLKIKELGIDYDTLLDQAADLYNKFGDKLTVDKLQDIANGDTGALVKSSVGDFFSSIGEKIKSFFTGLFGG
ncbi:MAG: DUF1002 domain-containing protein [Lachnospiraceae bacterium]|nr:DUF1002 domain-containing protein [Lachnospiraceae bacterium]